jgi:hypothetical protein
MIGDRKELEENLIKDIKLIKRKRKVISDIKQELVEKYDLMDGTIQDWIRDPETHLPELEIRELFLITQQVFLKTGDLEINPDDYFTEVEAKESRKYSASIKRNEFEFPATFTNATLVGNSAYMIPMNVQVIDEMLSSMAVTYDFELQREAKMSRDREGGVRIEPTLNRKNVDEIEEHLLQGTLVPTTLVFNAMTRTSDIGDELVYDASKQELTITKGTELAIVDGFHRCKAVQKAIQRNPDIKFNFAVLITNYSKKQAQQYQAQLAKATPISKVRVQELEANRHADSIVRQLREESDLKGRISQTNRIHSINKEIVTYNVLSDTIEEQFKIETKADAMDVGDYLVDYFNILLGSYPEEFLFDPVGTRKESLICDNNMFVGYIILARKLYERGIKAKEVRKYIKNIDFSLDNPIWKEIEVLDNKNRIADTVRARRSIANYFNNIDVEETVM